VDYSFFIPITMFVCLAIVGCCALFVLMRGRAAQQETLRQAIQTGQQLDARTLAMLAKPVNTPEADLRTGIVNASIGLGLVLIGAVAFFSGFERDFAMVVWFVAIFMGSLGAGQLLAWKIRTEAASSENEG
jgi:Domain of unknown function (DUF6249)